MQKSLMANVICKTSKIDKSEGKEKVSSSIKGKNRSMLLIALAIVVLILSLPLISQTHIQIEVRQNSIADVYVTSPTVSLVSTVISPPEEKGANTVIITVQQTGEEFSINNIPDGEYTIVWVSNGLPQSGTYTITVELIQNNITLDTFVLTVSF